MAVSLNHNILLMLAQSRLRENLKITQNRQRSAQRWFNRYVRRRRLVSSLFFRFLNRFLLQHLPVRRIWLRSRWQIFWEEICQDWEEKDWSGNFRMSKEAFNRLRRERSPHISKRDTDYVKAITVRHRVAITLYWFADTAHVRTIGNLFDVGKSTVCGIERQVCEVIVNVLPPNYINVPQNQHEVAVDCNYLFLDICVGWPGKIHDARVFKNSPLFTLCCARAFLPLDMSVMIYALSNWLMKLYIDSGNLTPEERSFNIKHSTTRVVVENAFGRLKVRFGSIGKRLDLKVENACDVIAACCVLHNYCEIQNESFDDQ